MKKILIALDYNPSAERVAETGYKIAKALKAEVQLIHVITDPAYYAMEYSPIMGYKGTYTTDTIALIENIRTEAENFLAASATHLGDSNIQPVVLEGETTDTILDYSEKWGADLIVMGSHSRKGIEGLLASDTAAHILKHSKVPLLTIPTETK